MGHEEFDVHVAPIDLPFRSVDAGSRPGSVVAGEFAKAWPAYRRWYLHEGEQARPSYAECRGAIRRWMPELAADYDDLVDVVGGTDLEARFLSHWCPPPLVAACSMVIQSRPEPTLIRNYDYPPLLSDALALRTHWSGTSVLGMADCGWGLMDGVSDRGLAISIAFGGRRNVGTGFGIGLVVRYLLQVSNSTSEAVARLERVPVQMSYNVAIVDATGDHRVVHVAPDRPAVVTPAAFAANRQGETEWPEHAEYCNTVEREEVLASLVGTGADVTRLRERFLAPPLHRSLLESTWGTLYTATYSPVTGGLILSWPDDEWFLSVHGDQCAIRPRTVYALVPESRVLRSEEPHRTRVPMVM